MELEDVQSDLHALKKLYGLLQSKGNNPQNDGASQTLDEKAKLVLKKLLDGATKQIISDEQHSVGLEDHQTKLESLVPPDRLSKTTPIDTILNDSGKDIHFNPVTSQTRKRCRICGKNKDRDHRRNRNSSVHHHEVSISSARPPTKESGKGIDNSKKPKLNKIHDVKCNKKISGSQEMWLKSEPAWYTSVEQNENKAAKMVADFVMQIGAHTKGLDPMKDNGLFATKYKSNKVKEEAVEMDDCSQDSRLVGVVDAMQRIEERIRANQQMLSQRVVNAVQDMKAIESKHEASKTSQLLEMKDGSSHKNISSHLAIERDWNHKDTSNALPPKIVTSRVRNNLQSQSTREIGKTKEATSTMDQKLNQKPYRFTAGINDSAPIQKNRRAKKSTLPVPISRMQNGRRKPIRERNQLSSHKTNLTNKSVLDRVTSPSLKAKESIIPTQMLTQTTAAKIQASTRQSGNVLPPKATGKAQGSTGTSGNVLRQTTARIQASTEPSGNILPQTTAKTQVSTASSGNVLARTTAKIQASTGSSGNVLPQSTAKIQAPRTTTKLQASTGNVLPPKTAKLHVSQGKIGTNELPRLVDSSLLKEHLMGPPQKRDLTRKTTNQNRRPLDVSHKLSMAKEYDKPHQHIILPTLLNGTHEYGQLDPLKKQTPYQQNSQPTSISSESESESASTSASYSTASDQKESSSGSCSESDSDPQPRRMLTHHRTGPTSQSKSPNVGRTRERTRSVEHDATVSPSRHVNSTAITKSNNRKTNEKEVGRLRRFKNKLGIIFHHHHHHHHHHHDADEVVTTAPDHHRTLWNYLGDILHHRTSNKDNGRKSMVKNTPHQNQHGYLHTLVDGLIRHVRHSKISKKSEANMKRLARNDSRKKKAIVKKWHWWQKLRGNSTNSGKTRVKVGFKAKRPLLRAPTPD